MTQAFVFEIVALKQEIFCVIAVAIAEKAMTRCESTRPPSDLSSKNKRPIPSQ
jgi:hypothetical protein